jgi:N utilization substance protein A
MNNELLTVINYMERERGVSRELIIQAIESALEAAARKSLGITDGLRVNIDRKTLAVKAFQSMIVSDDDTGPNLISLRKAREIKPDAIPGEEVEVALPPAQIGRIGAQNARQMIMQKIRQAERDNAYLEYKDRIGDIVSGTVRQVVRRDLLIDIGKVEALLPARERIPKEEFEVGDTLRAYVLRVQPSVSGSSVILSRACPEFVKALFRIEVSEIADGIVEVMGVARDPGNRAKIAVRSHDDKVDPVGACVGLRGARVRNIVRELNGERVDIIRWHEEIRQYTAQALSPARLASVMVVSEASRMLRVLVDPDQLSLAIGRQGQNVRLTSKLLGWKVDIQRTDIEESFESRVAHAVDALAAIDGIERGEAELLVTNGFLTPEGIMEAEPAYLQEATGLPEAAIRRIWDAVSALSVTDEAVTEEDGEA